MKRFLLGGIVILALVAAAYGYLCYRWRGLTDVVARMEPYQVARHHDDTLRVVMIGDSWAGLHHKRGYDRMMQGMLDSLTAHRPVAFASNGRGGAKSGEIYRLMFADAVAGDSFLDGYSTEPLLKTAPDYCIVMAGINDAAACLGVEQYCGHYQQILETLIGWGICPVVVEMPPVAIRELYAEKPLRDKVTDWMHALVAGSPLYDVVPYSLALLHRLRVTGLADRVLIVGRGQWNEEGTADSRGLYLPDGIHLNARGYQLLDSCLAVAIASHSK